jgi:hypothetical protein
MPATLANSRYTAAGLDFTAGIIGKVLHALPITTQHWLTHYANTAPGRLRNDFSVHHYLMGPFGVAVGITPHATG